MLCSGRPNDSSFIRNLLVEDRRMTITEISLRLKLPDCHRASVERIIYVLQMINAELSPHPLYSPDLDPFSFWLFLTVKKHLCSRRFVPNNEVINKVHAFFNSLPQAKFEKTIKVKWLQRIKLCIANEGWYFEKV